MTARPPEDPTGRGAAPLRVLVVEDEPVAAAAHTAYVARVPGFEVAGTARTGQEAVQMLATRAVDVVLMDMHLPDRHGLDVVRAMRASGHRADVIAVTSARDLQVVRAAVSLGVVQYLLKPFAFAALKDRLEKYAAYRAELAGRGQAATQDEIDRMLGDLRPRGQQLPKGMTADLLGGVSRALQEAGPESSAGLSATEVAGEVGVSRVTARRYLEHLVESGLASKRSRYAGQGRPEVEYRWR